jgi:pimeloyl-ACP methyl ester carboxylesterase
MAEAADQSGQTGGHVTRADGVALAWAGRAGKRPTVVFLPGFASDMTGTKATVLDGFCAARGQGFLRFDYAGHGASGGAFADGTIGSWTADALAVIDAAAADGPLVLVGSSMGGWIALLVALARPDRVAGLIGVAAAPDFTEALMWEAMTFEERARLMAHGSISVPNPYGPPTPVTRALIEDGRRHLLLTGAPIGLRCPVRLLHGQADREVPWELALRTAEAIGGGDVQVTLLKDGDHRLSRPADLALLERTVDALLGENGA